MGARAAAGGCVVGIDAETGLYHQGAVWRAVLALIIGALAAGLAVTGSFPGRPQVGRASDAEGLVGGQALHLPRLHTPLAGARTRTPGRRKPSVPAVLPLARLQGRGPGQVGAVAGGSHVELSAPFGHTDDVSALRAGAALGGALSPGPRVPAPRHLTGSQAAGPHVRGTAAGCTALLTGPRSRFLLARPMGLPAPEADHGPSLDSGPTLSRALGAPVAVEPGRGAGPHVAGLPAGGPGRA